MDAWVQAKRTRKLVLTTSIQRALRLRDVDAIASGSSNQVCVRSGTSHSVTRTGSLRDSTEDGDKLSAEIKWEGGHISSLKVQLRMDGFAIRFGIRLRVRKRRKKSRQERLERELPICAPCNISPAKDLGRTSPERSEYVPIDQGHRVQLLLLRQRAALSLQYAQHLSSQPLLQGLPCARCTGVQKPFYRVPRPFPLADGDWCVDSLGGVSL